MTRVGTCDHDESNKVKVPPAVQPSHFICMLACLLPIRASAIGEHRAHADCGFCGAVRKTLEPQCKVSEGTVVFDQEVLSMPNCQTRKLGERMEDNRPASEMTRLPMIDLS